MSRTYVQRIAQIRAHLVWALVVIGYKDTATNIVRSTFKMVFASGEPLTLIRTREVQSRSVSGATGTQSEIPLTGTMTATWFYRSFTQRVSAENGIDRLTIETKWTNGTKNEHNSRILSNEYVIRARLSFDFAGDWSFYRYIVSDGSAVAQYRYAV